MPRTTANVAPAVTPSRPGSASGLRVWPCMSAPATPRREPTIRPSTVRGMRRSWTIVALGAVGVEERVEDRARRDARLPIARLSTHTTTSASTRSTSPRSRALPRRPGAACVGWRRRGRRVEVMDTGRLTYMPGRTRPVAGERPGIPGSRGLRG